LLFREAPGENYGSPDRVLDILKKPGDFDPVSSPGRGVSLSCEGISGGRIAPEEVACIDALLPALPSS
jgi:hypothetical protein